MIIFPPFPPNSMLKGETRRRKITLPRQPQFGQQVGQKRCQHWNGGEGGWFKKLQYCVLLMTPSVDHTETEKEKHTHCYCRELRFDRHTVFRIGGKSFFLKVVVAIVCWMKLLSTMTICIAVAEGWNSTCMTKFGHTCWRSVRNMWQGRLRWSPAGFRTACKSRAFVSNRVCLRLMELVLPDLHADAKRSGEKWLPFKVSWSNFLRGF